jgi:hypothetical protein
MYSRIRENAVALGGAVFAGLIVSWLALGDWTWTDYDSEARPALDALVQGHPVLFLKLAPAYGGSLLLRAPFVLVPKLWGGGELSMFRAAAAPCLAAAALLGVWLVSKMRARGDSLAARALVLCLCVANPIVLPALQYGHPEELLGAVLCVAAVLAAVRDRPLWAGVLLGLAVANKEWAILAVGPVLIALPDRRIRTLLYAGATAGAVLLPFVIAGGVVSQTSGAATSTGSIFNPWQLWWFLGSHSHPVRDLAGHIRPGYRVAPAWVTAHSHELIAALVVPLTLLYAATHRRWRAGHPTDGLLLLALLFLLRCALDPWDMAYYPLPFLISLTTWETLRHRRLPVLSLLATLAAWFAIQEVAKPQLHLSPELQAAIFLVVSVAGIVALAVALYLPGLADRLAPAARRRGAVAVPA